MCLNGGPGSAAGGIDVLSFGVFLSYNEIYPEQDGSTIYREMLEQGILADQLGYDVIWLPEHHLIQFMKAPNALLSAVQIGQHVRCRVGTAVVVLPYHHPLISSADIAEADNILA